MQVIPDSDQDIPASPSCLRMSFHSFARSSGTFEMIQCSNSQYFLFFILTARENIIQNEPTPEIHQLTGPEWRQLLATSNSYYSIINHIRITYSICKGLSEEIKVLYWQQFLNEKFRKNELRSQNSHKEKYGKCIREAVDKLREKVRGLFGKQELDDLIGATENVLVKYYNDDPEVGFSRNMEYIAFGLVTTLSQYPFTGATLLQNLDYYFCIIFKKRKLRQLFFPGNPGMFSQINDLREDVQQQLPRLFQKIQSLGKEWPHLFYKHFLTALMHNLPHRELYTIITELLVLEGDTLVFYVLKRILYETEEELLKMGNQELEHHLVNNLFREYITRNKEEDYRMCMFGIMVKIEKLNRSSF